MTNLRQNTELANFNIKNFYDVEEGCFEKVAFMYKGYTAELYGIASRSFDKYGFEICEFNKPTGHLLDESESIIRELTQSEANHLAQCTEEKMQDDDTFLAEYQYQSLNDYLL
ncbi:hypothetical protein [Ornithobacterium rhinotracheale]